MSTTSAIPVAAVLSVLLIGHAMFVNGPVDEVTPTPQSTASSTPTSAPPQAD
jgi:hypothetical protein